MTVQRRPLTGMVVAGIAAPRAIDNAAPTTLHTLDQSATQQGGPFVDMVSLSVENTTGGALTVTIIVAGGASVVQSIPANTVSLLFDQQPFQAASSGSAAITGQGSGAGLVFWGWFARPL